MIDLNNNGTDDFVEIANGLKKFVGDEAKLLEDEASDAWSWLQDELAGLPEAAQQYFQGVLIKVGASSGSLGEQIADALTILYNDGLHEATEIGQEASDALKAVSSQVVSAAVGLINSAPKV